MLLLNQENIINTSKYRNPYFFSLWIIVFIILFSIFYNFFWKAPSGFPEDSVVTVSTGESLTEITSNFKEKGYIKSESFFQNIVILLGGEKKIIAGDYLLKHKENVGRLAWRIIRGDFGMEPVKVTIPEGFSNKEIAELLGKKIINFNSDLFLADSMKKEGFMFPDTYFFPPTALPQDIIVRMEENFAKKIEKFKQKILEFKKTENEVIVMASILEGEAKDLEAKQIVSGILWERIKKGMPLQVDATFKYIIGKTTEELTLDDLKIKSPYNTYVNKGLPPAPINNPGEKAIFATLNPIKTPYLYFLTGDNGKMYYAKTFEEHKKNKEEYLR